MSRSAASALLLAAVLAFPTASFAGSVPVPPRPAPVAGVEPARDWPELVRDLAAVEAMTADDAATVAYPKFDAFMRSGSPKRWEALRLAVESFGFNSGLLSSYVVEAMSTEAVDRKDEAALADVGRIAAANAGLAMTVSVSLAGTKDSLSSPGGRSFLSALLHPKFPQDRDPTLCYVHDVLSPALPAWGTDEAFDAGAVRILATCPTVDTGAVGKGLADPRATVRLQAIAGWDDARRQRRPAGRADPETVDAMFRLLTSGSLPKGGRSEAGRPAMDVVASAMIEAGREDEALAELGNAGREDDYDAFSRAVKTARTPKGAYSLDEILN